MKSQRHDKILELVLSKCISTQEELQDELKNQGIVVTQATISRDIKDLKLIKEMNADGCYCYVTGAKKALNQVTNNFGAVFYESVVGVDYSGNMVVIQCRHGMANAACATLDNTVWDGVVGTLAGDDTIFVLMRTNEDAITFTREIYNTIRKNS